MRGRKKNNPSSSSQSVDPVQSLINEWKTYKTLANGLMVQSALYINEHDNYTAKRLPPPHDLEIIDLCNKSLEKIDLLHKKILALLDKIAQINPNEMVSSIQDVKKESTGFKIKLFQQLNLLKKTTSDKYIFFAKTFKSKNQKIVLAKRLEFFNKADTLLTEAIETYKIHPDFITAESKGFLDDQLSFIRQSLVELTPKPNDKIPKILLAAKANRNKDESYNQCNEALKLTEDPAVKFSILLCQGYEYLKKSSDETLQSIKTIDDFQIMKKAYGSLILAAELRMKIPNTTFTTFKLNDGAVALYKDIYEQVNRIVNYINKFSLEYDKKLEILNDAKSYLECADKLGLYINDTIPKAFNLDDLPRRLTAIIEQLHKEKEKQEAKAAENVQKPEEEKQEDMKLPDGMAELIAEEEAKQQHKHKKTSKPSKALNNSNVDSDSDSDDENRITEYNLKSPPRVQKKVINRQELQEKLTIAKKENNFIEQINIYVLLAEDYKAESLSLNYDRALANLAKDAIFTANKIYQAQKYNGKFNAHRADLEKCISIVLQNVKQLYDKANLKKERIQKFRKRQDQIAGHEHDKESKENSTQTDNTRESEQTIKEIDDILKQYNYTLKDIQKDEMTASRFSATEVTAPPTTTAQQNTILQSTTIAVEEQTAAGAPPLSTIQFQPEVCHSLELMAEITDDITLNILKIKLTGLTDKHIKFADEQDVYYLSPLFNGPFYLIAYLSQHYTHYVECFNVLIELHLLPYLLPVPVTNWPLTNAAIDIIKAELQQMDQSNAMPTEYPKDQNIVFAHFIMAILARTDTINLSFTDLTTLLTYYLAVDPLLEKSIEIYQNYYLQQREDNDVTIPCVPLVPDIVPKPNTLQITKFDIKNLTANSFLNEVNKDRQAEIKLNQVNEFKLR